MAYSSERLTRQGSFEGNHQSDKKFDKLQSDVSAMMFISVQQFTIYLTRRYVHYLSEIFRH